MANNDKNFKVKNGLDVKGSATVDNDLLVSGTLTAQVNTPTQDSDVVNKAYVDAIDTHDEAAVNSQIDSAFNVKSTTDLSEGNNLYYTTARADSAFDIRLATKTTTNLAEGNNLYYTTARADSDTRALVDSDYIEGKIKQSFIDTFDTHDSAAVQGQINATISATDTHDSAAVQVQIDSAVTLAFINSLDASTTNWDSDLIPGLVLGADVNGNYVVDVTGTANQIEVTHTQGEGSTPVIGLPNNVTIDSDLTVNGVIKGPSTFIIDPALHGDSSGTLVILGNLQVDGVSTIIQSNTVSITDKNIVLADSATNGTEANGAGITVNGANASITYVVGNDNWEFNKAPYYLANRLLTTADDLHDSAAVQGQIDSAVTLAFINSLDASATDWDSDLIPQLRTDDVNEGTNLYYTDTRARASVSGNKGLTYNSSTGVFDIDSANIYSFTIDSARTIGLIDSAYIEARIKQSFIDTFDTHDSAAVVGQIGLEVTKTFIDNLDVDAITLGGNDSSYYLDYNNFTNTPTLPAQVISYDSASELADSAVNARTDQDLFTTSDVEFAKVTTNLVGSVHFTAQNDEGTALAKGDVVYIKGISGNTPTVAKADADDATKMPAFGVVYDDNANNGANVTITTLSVLEGIDTQTPGWSEGDTLYVATVAGQLTNTKPTGESSLIQNIGQVTRVHNSTGSIKILGAGRTAATPNLDLNRIFIGNASNQAITMSLDSAVDSDHVQSKIKQSFIDTFDTHDSAAVVGQINLEVDKTFVDTLAIDYNALSNKPTIPTFGTDYVDSGEVNILIAAADTHDSAAVVGQINLEVDQAFVNALNINADQVDGQHGAYYLDYNNFTNTPTIPTLGTDYVDSAEVNLLIAAADTHDSAAVQGQIDSAVTLAFINNLDASATDWDSDLIPTLRTDDVNEGTNLYYTDTRARASVSGNKGLTYNSSTGVFDIDSANIYSFTIDSARTIDLIDSAYIQPLARAAIVAGSNITYDSATGIITSSGGGTSSSHTLAIGLLDTSLPQALDVGDPIYYDSDAVKWTGAKAADADVASHIIVEKDGSNFKIAQTGVFTLTPNQGLDINSYYYLGDSAGFYTNTQPTTGINQVLFYAVDSSTIDINVAEATDLTATSYQALLDDAVGAATAMAIVF